VNAHLELGVLELVGRSFDSFVPSRPRNKESGIDTRPALWNRDGLTPVVGFTGAPETPGEKPINPTQAISPP
jgi:hypothetical protein